MLVTAQYLRTTRQEETVIKLGGFEVFTAVITRNTVFGDIKIQFVLNKIHITSPLQIPADQCYVIFEVSQR
jgi:hypothetical protein